MTLSPAHREHLRTKRGLTDEQIGRFGFKSTPPAYLCRTIAAQLVKQGCVIEGVPGFYVDDSGKWRAKFHQRTSGIVIPLRGVDGLLQGLQIRLDRPIRDKDDPPEKYDGELLHPNGEQENIVLERIFARCNDHLPEGYSNHS